MPKKKKIAYVTGTRADFGLMTPILQAISKSSKLDLELYATGMHFLPRHGNTIKLVKNQFPQVISIKATFHNDSLPAVAKFNSEFLQKITRLLTKNKPDLMLVLGDRSEMLLTALACLYLNIPIGHIHGGDKTTTIDDIARHAITKLSHLHFTATKDAAGRIKKMGEESWRINIVGAPAIDAIKKLKLPSIKDLVTEKFILITLHPISEDAKNSGRQMQTVIRAVEKFGLHKVIIYPNADPGSKAMIRIISSYENDDNFTIFKNLEYKKFLALQRQAAVWVGNSSAGVIESASFKTPVINVGNRQSGRPQSVNIINVPYDRKKIEAAVTKVLTDKAFRNKLRSVTNVWGDGDSARKIIKILEQLKIDKKLLGKKLTY